VSEQEVIIAKEENSLIDTVNGIFDEYDDDGSGTLDQEETCKLLDVILKNQGMPPVTVKGFARFFKEYDINGDGLLSKGEMAIFVQQFLDSPARDEPESSMKSP
jgi:Ca2+-binding EF-hand superfamily protein|tara:strand:- start:2117 stop:2428 length:312 start_codon:yes stop_codon:yes gene_type:complete